MGNEKVSVNIYAEGALRAMQTADDGRSRAVYVVVHTRTSGPGTDMHDACPGETCEEVFEELNWELAMADLKRFA